MICWHWCGSVLGMCALFLFLQKANIMRKCRKNVHWHDSVPIGTSELPAMPLQLIGCRTKSMHWMGGLFFATFLFIHSDSFCPLILLARPTLYIIKLCTRFVVLVFVITLSFSMNVHDLFTHIRQGCLIDIGKVVWLPWCESTLKDRGEWHVLNKKTQGYEVRT